MGKRDSVEIKELEIKKKKKLKLRELEACPTAIYTPVTARQPP